MEIYVDKHPEWLRRIAPEEFNDADFFRIVVFFVFHSPCEKVSAMGKTLAEYGWNNPWKSTYHLRKQLKQASQNFNLIFPVKKYCEMDDALERANLYNPSATKHGRWEYPGK